MQSLFHMENSQSRSRWSDLPRELLSLIGKRLDTCIDVLRFRSVCRSWRASLPKSNAVSLLSRLRFPSPNRFRPAEVGRQFYDFLIRRIIYCISPLQTYPYSPPRPAAWLAKMESPKFGKMRFHHQVSQQYIKRDIEEEDIPPGLTMLDLVSDVNFLDLQFHEVARSYSLEYLPFGCPSVGVTKVVMSPASVWTDRTTCTIVAIYDKGKLGFAKQGCGYWTLIDNHNFNYDDLIVYKGKIITVNRRGTVSSIDSSMKLEHFSPKLTSGNKKHLVECHGELYGVERVTLRYFRTVIDFNVYKLIEKEGRWEKVSNLGDEAFVLGNDCCFSVSASKFEGLDGNSIYFARSSEFRGCTYNIFDLEDGEFYEEDTYDNVQISGPPPRWIEYNF